MKYCFENPDFKSVIPLYLSKKINKKSFENILKFRRKSFKDLHNYIYKNCKGIIASDLDYHLPLIGNSKYSGLIPNPINISKIKFSPLKIENKIIKYECNKYKITI